MKRRSLIKLSFSLSILSFLGLYSNSEYSSGGKLEVIFKLPEGMSFKEYEQTVPRWVNFSKFKSVLSKYYYQGTLLRTQKIYDDSRTLRTVYHFTNEKTALQFCEESMKSCNYNFAARDSLGIQTKTYINGKRKEFTTARGLGLTVKG